jgi:hypothetical protein
MFGAAVKLREVEEEIATIDDYAYPVSGAECQSNQLWSRNWIG